jgi:hypothetical protein
MDIRSIEMKLPATAGLIGSQLGSFTMGVTTNI